MHPQPLPPTVSPLNVEVMPYQPTQTTKTPPTIDVKSHVINRTLIPAASHTEDTPLEHGSTVPPNPTELVHVPGNVTSQFTTRLPKLTLPTFSGNPLMWQEFWDSFSAAVHSNSSLTGVHKFNYLRAQVTDKATKCIAGFPLTNNYEHSITLLREQFGQPQRIVNAHIQALLSLPNPSNNLTSLRSFHDSVENHIRRL